MLVRRFESTISSILFVALAAAAACKGGVAGGGGEDPPPCSDPATCPCATSEECPKGLVCLDWQQQAVCLTPCVTGCAEGWRCEGLPDAEGEITLACLPAPRGLCVACTKDEECGGEADHCIAIAAGTFCSVDCTTASCPLGYGCTDVVSIAGVPARQCVPDSGSCRCLPESAGYERSCERTNMYGTCYGVEQCTADGTFSPCTAATPRQETCNGVDDDCDGLVDRFDPTLAPPADATDYPACATGPACTGEWVCGELEDGTTAWACTAQRAVAELCNGIDDDCDGVADNGLMDASGRYVSVEACGECGRSCTAGIANLALDSDGKVAAGAVSCEVIGGATKCVVHACAPGFAPYPAAGQASVCMPVTSLGCAPCTTAADCSGPTDLCLKVGEDEHQSCALDCAAGSPHGDRVPCTGVAGEQGCCPDGFSCTEVGDDAVCIPNSGSCQCAAGSVGLVRPCVTSGVGGGTCIGTAECQLASPGVAAFSACDASGTTRELCNGLDDDCDNSIDEDFIAQHGSTTYDTDEHCGVCGMNCPNRWNSTAHHVTGQCELAPTPHCAFDPADCQQLPGPGGKPCDQGCNTGAGEVCLTRATPGVRYDYFQCAKPCTLDSQCGASGRCVDGGCTRTCTNDTPCAAYGPLSRCLSVSPTEKRCLVTYQWRDLDGRQVTGCECPAAMQPGSPPTLPLDEPRTFATYPTGTEVNAYLDSNCDGVDGEAAAAVFVSAASQGTPDGSREHPWPTIAQGLTALRATAGKSYVLVATGLYRENVVLAKGDRLYGGYASDFRERNIVRNRTTIVGVEPSWGTVGHELGTVTGLCTGWTGSPPPLTELSGFTITGYDVTFVPAPGQQAESAYAVYLRDCGSYVHITNNNIVGGQGGVAATGVDGGIGQIGGAGKAGERSQPCCADRDNTGEISLGVDANPISIVVTAANGTATKTYTVTVTRASVATNNADLSGLAISAGTLTPAFAAGTTAYTATVANNVTSLTVTPNAADAGASILVAGAPVASGSASSPIVLDVGVNRIVMVVSPANRLPDATSTKTYVVAVTRQAGTDTNADLASLTLSAGALTPAFSAAVTSYTMSVANGITKTTVTPTVANANATVKVATTPVVSGAGSAPINLHPGANPIEVAVSAGDGTSHKTYTVTITRQSGAGANASLTSLTLSAGALTPAFDPAIVAYTIAVANGVKSTTVSATAAAGATIRVLGGACPSCGSALPGGDGGLNLACSTVATTGARGKPSNAWTGGDTPRGNYHCDSTYCTSACRYDCGTGGGGDGADGGDGANGSSASAGGTGCVSANGSIVASDEWRADGGAGGGAGNAGSGGAAGGSGGWVSYADHNSHGACAPDTLFNRGDFGGTGGGGGAGGCGGGGGAGGGGGGAAIAVFVVPISGANTPVIAGNRIERGSGGRGGNGGYGGPGGAGGLGGLGGMVGVEPDVYSWCGGLGGNGGRGGSGGAGGGGGGGCGGVSFAIAGAGIPASYVTANTIVATSATGGARGLGGLSPAGVGAAGAPGTAGSAGDFHSY